MRRAFAMVVVLALLALGAGFLWLGAFPPPPPHATPVEHSIPTAAVGAG